MKKEKEEERLIRYIRIGTEGSSLGIPWLAAFSWRLGFDSTELTDIEKLQMKILYAQTLRLGGNNIQAKSVIRETIDTILEKEALDPVGTTRNKVFTASGNILSRTLVYKTRASDESLEGRICAEFQQELRNIEFFSEDSPVEIVRPMDIIPQYKGLDNMILGYAGISLDKHVMEHGYKREYFEQAVTALAHYHARDNEERKIEGYQEKEQTHTERALEKGFEQIEKNYGLENILGEGKEEFKEKYKLVQTTLDNALQGPYVDATQPNWIVEEYEEEKEHLLKRIDFEGARKTAVQLDLVSLLEFGPLQMPEEEKRELIEQYIKEYEKIKQTTIERDSFFRAYQAAQIQRHLELAGYRARDAHGSKENIDYRRMMIHLQKAREAAAQFYEAPPEAMIIPIQNLEEKLAA